MTDRLVIMKKLDALKYFKTQSAISKALCAEGYAISQPAISKWKEVVPEVPARLLAQASNNTLIFDELVYRSPIAQTS